MIKTKIFLQGFDELCIDKQINKWIAKHLDYIIVDIKLQSNVVGDDINYYTLRNALVIYREYENQKEMK